MSEREPPSLPTDTRFTVGLAFSASFRHPFHCWSLPSRPASRDPFHCWFCTPSPAFRDPFHCWFCTPGMPPRTLGGEIYPPWYAHHPPTRVYTPRIYASWPASRVQPALAGTNVADGGLPFYTSCRHINEARLGRRKRGSFHLRNKPSSQGKPLHSGQQSRYRKHLCTRAAGIFQPPQKCHQTPLKVTACPYQGLITEPNPLSWPGLSAKSD